MRTAALFTLAVSGLFGAEIQPAGVPEFHQPQVAAGYGKVAIAYGSGTAIWFATSPDGGRTFGQRVQVGDVGALALGRHRGPRITILPDSILLTAVVGREPSHAEHAHGLPDRGELQMWRSADGGKTWAASGQINDVPAAAEEGLHSIASDSHGTKLFAAWLDHRNKGTELYGAQSVDGGRTWSKNVRIYASPDGTICQCCDPSVAIDSKGAVHVMWRNALAGSRDLYLTRSADGVHFSPAEKLGEGTWKIDACPMDGGGMALDQDKIVTVWRRTNEIFLAKPGEREQRLAEGKDVAIVAGTKGIYVAWSTAHGIEVMTPGAKAAVRISDEGGFPVLAALPDGSVLAAWEQDGVIKTGKLQ